jgi:hypothetical protein
MLYLCCQSLPSIRKIPLKFLLLEQTNKGADTVHSTITTFIKRTVWAPSQWPLVMSFATANPMAFIVKKLEFSDFENWPAIQNSLLPINKQDASGRRIRWSLLPGLSFNKSLEDIEVWYSFHRREVSKVQNVIT